MSSSKRNHDNVAIEERPESKNLLTPTTANSSILPKNFSASNLSSYASKPSLAVQNPKNRFSLDASTLLGMELDKLSKSPIIPEHAGEHGLGLSGLRRIRQQPSSARNAELGSSTGPNSRSASLSTSINTSQFIPPSTPTVGASTSSLNTIQDLKRFPTESLHSFSFAHQSDESIHNRQNVLKRSMDFMRDRLGWAASNPGLVAAQARLCGDQEVQSMMELLSRAQLIGEEAAKAHGLGVNGPLTGPADLAGNPFEKSFATEMSQSPDGLDESKNISNPADASPRQPKTKPPLVHLTTLEHLAKATTDDSIDREAIPSRPRAMLKRTFTDLGDMTLRVRLTDTLAQPYSVNEGPSTDQSPSGSAEPSNHFPQLPPFKIPPIAPVHVPAPQSAAPHGHGNRSTPASQAIFTTEANSPWTITAANDLACLVFGVTRAEVRKLGILEVVKEERRTWLAEKLRDPNVDTGSNGVTHAEAPRVSPAPTTTLNVGNGITARLLSRPPSRHVHKAKRRSQTEGIVNSKSNGGNGKVGHNHASNKSRGVLLCGDVVPIQKRNGSLGSASIWVKEKKGGLIWVVEEIAEDVAYVEIDEVGCVVNARGQTEEIWGIDRVRRGMEFQRLIPSIPRRAGTHTGALDYHKIDELRSFTARTANDINIPITIEEMSNVSHFRVSSFPHIAGIMVLDSETLDISSVNTVFSAALFGQIRPEGLNISEIIPNFDKLLHLMTDEDNVRLVDGIVIPEHSFRRARALLAMREGKKDAASVFLRPSGVPAKHRDGYEIMVDLQMRVVKNDNPYLDDQNEIDGSDALGSSNAEIAYALWITYSRQLHAANHGVGWVPPPTSLPPSPRAQPSPGQLFQVSSHEDPAPEDSPPSIRTISLLTQQLKAEAAAAVVTTHSVEPIMHPIFSNDPSSKNGTTVKKNIKDFVVLEDMGQGAYGQVKLCRYKRSPSKKMVIKYVTKRRILVDTWTRDRRLGTVPLEIHVLDYLRRDEFRHPYIVEMADFFEDDVNYYIEMVPHGMPGMDLFDYIELCTNMEEWEARKIFVQVAQAIYHLHVKAKVVHRDIKDENVILDGEGNIKLIDFGSAAYIKNGPFDVFVGTIDYAAPEVLAGQSYRGKEQDVWALGILLYTIIYKENPFYSIDEIMDHDLRVPYIMSDSSIELIRLMLNRDVTRRVKIEDVVAHSWCQGVIVGD